MNEQIEKALTGTVESLEVALNSTINAVGKGTEFILQEIPLVLQEFLVWRFWEACITGGFLLLLLAAPLWGAWKMIKWIKSDKYNVNDESDCFASCLGGFLLLGAIVGLSIGIVTQAKECVKIKVAPRVYILEEAVKMYHGESNK